MTDRRSEVLLELASYAVLRAGWDGELAAEPSPHALRDALAHVFALPAVPHDLEPSLHVDGSVLLEWGEGEGYLRFGPPTAMPT